MFLEFLIKWQKMAKRRTKKDIQQAQQKRAQQTTASDRLRVARKKEDALINYDLKFIRKDLWRSLLSSLMVAAILVALYFWL